MTLFSDSLPSASLQLAARLPINPETQYIPITSRYFQQPKWYQFIPRSLMMRPWLKGLLTDKPPYNSPRKGLIIADEGGVGKTKAAALCISHIYSINPEKSILLLVPTRLVINWRNEILSVNPKLKANIQLASYASKLSSLDKGKIFITSKDSFSKHSKSLFESWDKLVSSQNSNIDNKLFSLVVIDEAHKGKGRKGEGMDAIDEKVIDEKVIDSSSAMYRSISDLCKKYSEKNLAVTASPLSMGLSDLRNIARMVDVNKFLLGSIDSNMGEESNKALLNDWKQYIDEFRTVSEPLKSPNVSDSDFFEFFEFFSDTQNMKKIKLLPYHNEIIETMSSATISAQWNVYDMRMEWLNELNPYSSFLSIIKRQDLGEEANDLFRTRVTWTEHVDLHPDHMKRINQQDNQESVGGEMRQIHEWPTNPDHKGNYGDYRGSGISFDEPCLNGEILEPRLNTIVKSILPQDPVLSGKSKGNKGCVIFCFNIRTVDKISQLLNKQNIKVNGKNIKIITHRITGEVQNSINILNALATPANQLDEVYNVVVGTSAIQEGISMNWASTVVHWGLPTNPQTLEQRTWRLDRHRTEIDSDIFNTIYIVTNSQSDEELVDRILSRAETSNVILGQDHQPNSWPIKYGNQSEVNTRIYQASPKKFFYSDSVDLAKAWDHMIENSNSSEFMIRTEQQKQLFTNILGHYDLPVNHEKIIEDGIIEFEDWNKDSIRSLQRLLFYAEGMDLISLQRCFPVRNGRMNILSIDGFVNKSEKKGRKFAISLDPKGAFIRRILRRVTENDNCITGNPNADKSLIFSVETKDPIKNYVISFEFLYNKFNTSRSSLFIVEDFNENPKADSLFYHHDRFNLFKAIISQNQSSNQTQITTNQSEIADSAFRYLMKEINDELNSEMDQLEEDSDDLSSQINEREGSIYSVKDQNLFDSLKMQKEVKEDKIRYLDDLQKKFEKNHINDLFYPVVRYVQGGI